MTIARKIMARAKSIFAIAFTIVALSCASSAAFAQNAQDTQTTDATVPQQQVSQVQDQQRNVLTHARPPKGDPPCQFDNTVEGK